MDQNHWNDNDQTRSGRAEDTTKYDGEISYTGSYTYGSNTPTPPQEQKPRRKGNGNGRIVLVAVAVLLMLALCFGAGTLGSYVTRPQTESPDAPTVDTPDSSADEPDAQHPATDGEGSEGTGGKTDSAGNLSTPVDEVDRNTLPEMDKSQPLGKVTYTGSAGDNAYGSLAEAVDMVNETVVEIFTETTVNGGWLGNYVQAGAGSGVIISEDGYIVTNNHVIEGASTITVRMTDGTIYNARLVGTDASIDIAVIWVDAEKALPAAELGCSADLIVGEYVYAIGNPLGSLGGTVTDGIISATARTITVGGKKMTLLQTNAAVNPGNSGGGLFNMAGQLIGVVNAKYSEDSVEGLGFAIPIDTAYDVICQLIQYGYVRGIVDTGLDLYEITSSNVLVARRYFGMSYAGIYVLESAYSSEIEYGDLLIEINGISVTDADEYEAALEGLAVGDTVTLALIRRVVKLENGREVAVEQEVTVELVLREYVPEDAGIRFEAN